MKNLQKLLCVGAGILALSTGSCVTYSKYDFYGKLNKPNEIVSFSRGNGVNVLVLSLYNDRGKLDCIISLVDNDKNDLKVDLLTISQNGKRYQYTREDNPALFVDAQKQFDEYLERILEVKKSK